ncbi:MAG: hypothetical protein KGH55_02195 [Nanoarchaeota archaeon]|nr:hypothetical protein [Nanoarchaeota archaeon]
MRKGLIICAFMALTTFTGFASAQAFSLGQISSSIDPSNIILPIIFFILFLVIRISTNKLFKKNKGTGSVIAALLALAATYGTTKISTFSSWPSVIMSTTGISEGTFYTVGAIALLAFLVLFFILFRSWTFIILGGIFLTASFTGLLYSSGVSIIIGIILVLAGIILLLRRKKKAKPGLAI